MKANNHLLSGNIYLVKIPKNYFTRTLRGMATIQNVQTPLRKHEKHLYSSLKTKQNENILLYTF